MKNEEKDFLISLAKQAIQDEFDYTSLCEEQQHNTSFPRLQQNGASFVTLMLYGNLRGCIGSLIAQRPLGEDICYNAKAAAFRDPRFPKLSKEEFDNISLELSLLDTPQPLVYESLTDLKEKIIPFTHGVILSHQGHQATFLPSVWEQLPSFDLFFAHLLQKAGLPNDTLFHHPDILTYTVTKLS